MHIMYCFTKEYEVNLHFKSTFAMGLATHWYVEKAVNTLANMKVEG